MEAVKEESSCGSANTVKSKLRYPLRSATKKKDDKSAVTNTASTSPKRRKPQSIVGKSVGFLDTSGNDKPAMPSRRLSVRAKSSISPFPKSTGTINPSSDSRTQTFHKGQGSDEKPVSDVSKSISRKKFSILSSVSYWLSQIKLSESTAKHSVSLGFFKLALESGCEPLQQMSDELKSYASRHNLVELGEPLKELLTSYKISADMDQLKVSEICPQVSEESTQSSEAVHNSSIDNGKKLKLKASCSENVQVSTIVKTAKRRSTQKFSATKNRGSVNSNPIKSNNVPQKNSHRPTMEVT
ncbi:microtubule-associated futsch-like protein [Thalictrum thalictroides]|uniref:Microtubule-associated futsch-like protein n=1 Tax=Thalictrum thalictroides TaxID=46969 RepID=A0A7J6WPA8_THATH|nr:microtubule-associated futsch-like protein [Thalictrum thalictroides]